MAEGERPADEGAIEGEGSHSADREYRAGVEEHLKKADVEREAEQARRDLEAKPEEFRKAEEEARSRTAGDMPGDAEKI